MESGSTTKRMEKINYTWVTKWIKTQEWDSFYGQNGIYAPIRETRGGMVIGFLVAGDEIPVGCQIALPEEIEKIKQYRKEQNIYPR